MIDLDLTPSGVFKAGCRFSDIFCSAVMSSWSGALVVNVEDGDRVAFFDAGNPTHVVSAAGLDLIGELMVEMGYVGAPEVEAAVGSQLEVDDSSRQLLGQMLVKRNVVSIENIDHAMREQTRRRLGRLFQLNEGKWQAAGGGTNDGSTIGVPLSGKLFVLSALKNFSSSQDLRDVTEQLLGKSIRLKGTVEMDELGFEEWDRELVALLDKPRKPAQVERAGRSRRDVRAVLKLLSASGHLTILPGKKSVPIRSTINVPAPSTAPPGPRRNSDSAKPKPKVEGRIDVVLPRKGSSESTAPVPDTAQTKEFRDLFAQLGDLDYFEMLGATMDMDSGALRIAYTKRAKKFHPDVLGPDAPEEVVDMAKEIVSKLNEAYTTLNDEEKRATYIARTQAGESADEVSAQQREAARVKFDLGAVMLRRGDLSQARDMFRAAMSYDEDNAMYVVYYAWSIYSDRSRDKADALVESYELIRKTAEKCPEDTQAQFYAGQIFVAKGEEQLAKAAFTRVLEKDPKHDLARKALSRLGGTIPGQKSKKKKKDKDSKDPGIFGRLFKRS